MTTDGEREVKRLVAAETVCKEAKRFCVHVEEEHLPAFANGDDALFHNLLNAILEWEATHAP